MSFSTSQFRKRYRRRAARTLACALLVLGLLLPRLHSQQDGLPAPNAAPPAVKLKQPGLPNLGRVNDRLYRGGQPKSEGFEALRELGVEIVVNFNNSHDAIRKERVQVESRGMRYVSIPWSATSLPRKEQVGEFLRLMRNHPQARIFVHCRHGADRTGVMLAAYRMAFEGWAPEKALEEMERFKFHGFWYRHLKQYVRDFPALLRSHPDLISGVSPRQN